MADGSTVTTTTQRGSMNKLMSRGKAYAAEHKHGLTIGLVTAVVVIIAIALVLYFVVLKKPYRGGSKSKGSTRLVFEAQTQKVPSTKSADSGSSTATAPDLKALAKTIQADMRKQGSTKDVWVYPAGYADALWVANNDASFKSDAVALYKNKIPKTCVSTYKNATSPAFVVDGTAKTVTASTSTPSWGLFVVETSLTPSTVTSAATALQKTGTVKYGTMATAAGNADAAKTAVCTFTAPPKSS